ncbi:glutathione S-transferase D7-like [Haliotis asinina]|uniref:glutathione S-transferase D7-like n=1 Tax=Haliotis asinina TaxID=109174 RepID=UPI0035323853
MAGDSGKMKLYWYPDYRSVRAIWLLKELEAEQDVELVRFFPGGDQADDAAFRKDVHPHCTIPALTIPGDIPILESGAICMYLADKYGKLLPEPQYRQDYYNFLIYTVATIDGVLDFFYQLYGANMTFSDEKVQQMTDKLNVCFDFVSRRLQGRQYICGDKLTAVDCVFGYVIYYSTLLKDGALLKNYPKLQEYHDRIKKRPHYQATINMK